MKASRLFVTSSVLLIVGMAAAGAAQAAPTGDLPTLEQTYERRIARQQSVQLIQANKAAFVAELVGDLSDLRWEGRAELTEMLLSRSAKRLVMASAATTRADVLDAVFGVGPDAFGGDTSDLVFFPLTPCRLFDTRLAVGALSPGIVRTFGVNGTPGNPGDLSGQGGDASDCGVPVDPAAVVVTLAAVTPTGPGNIRAFATGDTVPLASALNYSPVLPALANTTVIPVCMACGTGLDIDIRADVSSVHLVGDVIGYFWSPTTALLDQTFPISAPVAVAPGADDVAISPDCPIGYSVTGGSCLLTSRQMRLSTSRRVGDHWVCAVENEGIVTANVSAEVICSRTPGR